MKLITTCLLFMVLGCSWREVICTCVLESDFGFTLNCAFKKSGLFRVRNLGGVKGYVGLGFTVGDELGFRESLSNLESSKRRSVQSDGFNKGNFIAIGNTPVKSTAVQGSRVVPPFKRLPPGGSRPMAPQPEHQRLVVQQNSTALRMIPAPSLAAMQDAAVRQQQMMVQQQMQAQQQIQAQQQKLALQQQQRLNQELKLRQQQTMQQEALALQMLKEQRLQQQEAMRQKYIQDQQISDLQTKRTQMPQVVMVSGNAAYPQVSTNVINSAQSQDKPAAGILISNGLPAFVAMPQSSSQLTNRISNSPTLLVDSVDEVSKDEYGQLPLPSEEMAATVNEMTLQSLNPAATVDAFQVNKQLGGKRESPMNLPSLAPIQGMETSLKALAEASNITLEALEAAILLRQKQLLEKQQGPSTTTSTTTASPAKNNYNNPGLTKVMNAPREYYPMGYDKNFDDNFASRVDLPDTSFYCGDQKHFPGLYADEDLGCMVFHVCALTDEGLIMKSFLCPESTLFDQTVLKCNWWFYVECKASKNLYDSNIPISKSYQLMKALAFFSAYKNHDNGTAPADESGGS